MSRRHVGAARVREIRIEPLTTLHNGRPALVNAPVIPADASPELREGIRRRRVTAALGRCPCGARRPAMTTVQEAAADANAAWVPTPHTADCLAHDDHLGPLIEAWKAGKGARLGSHTR